ncbi:MAG: phospholipase D family protein [Pseudomonadota bacterium]
MRFVILACALLFGLPAHALDPSSSGIGKTYAATGTVQVAFTPGDNADGMIVAAIRGARRQILVQAFSFTHRKIARALVAAQKSGIDVQLIADARQTERLENSAVPQIAAGGVAVFLDDNHDSAHNKVMVIDAGSADAAIITGSYNFTHAAQFNNAENVLLLRGNPQLADAYRQNWQRHRDHAQPYRKR